MRVTASTSYAVAGMFVVFAVWAAFGFAFPAEPLPLALNVISKMLCFVPAIMLVCLETGRGCLWNESMNQLPRTGEGARSA
jgi:hypothetical protein